MECLTPGKEPKMAIHWQNLYDPTSLILIAVIVLTWWRPLVRVAQRLWWR